MRVTEDERRDDDAVEGAVDGVAAALKTEERLDIFDAGVTADELRDEYEKPLSERYDGVLLGRWESPKFDLGGGMDASMEELGVSATSAWLTLDSDVSVNELGSRDVSCVS